MAQLSHDVDVRQLSTMPPPMTASPVACADRAFDVRERARASADSIAWAIGGTIRSGIERGMLSSALLRGIDREEFDRLAAICLAPLSFDDIARLGGTREPDRYDEFDDILALLKAHACDNSEPVRWLAHAFATAAMYENHLWQDLHLPDRSVLSSLFAHCFPSLYARNTGNMKWKKFLYKQLCDASEVLACKAPSCGVCSDYAHCFGSEDASGVVRTGHVIPIARA